MNILCKLWLDVPETTKTQPSIYIHYLIKGGAERRVKLAAEILDTFFGILGITCTYRAEGVVLVTRGVGVNM